MSTTASQITSLTVVYSIVHSGADQRKHQAPRHWPLCGEFTETGEVPAQRASNAENVSIWWRHHDDDGSSPIQAQLQYFIKCLHGYVRAQWVKYLNIAGKVSRSHADSVSLSFICDDIKLEPAFTKRTHMHNSYLSNIFAVTLQTCSAKWYTPGPFTVDSSGFSLIAWHHGMISATHDDVIKRKHFPRYWPFVRGIHQSPVNSPRKGQWRGALMFSLICTRINGWVNNREAGDLKRHCAHYDVTVMSHPDPLLPASSPHAMHACVRFTVVTARWHERHNVSYHR